MEKFQSNEDMQNGHDRQLEVWRDTVIEQILVIRDSGETNMFDAKKVFELALNKDFDELADFIFMNTSAYSRFILSGDRELLTKPEEI